MPVLEWDGRCLRWSWEDTLFRACEIQRAKRLDSSPSEQSRGTCSMSPKSAVFASALFAAFVAGIVCRKVFCVSNATTAITDDDQRQTASRTPGRSTCDCQARSSEAANEVNASNEALEKSPPSSVEMPFAGGHDGGVRLSLDGATVFKRFQHRYGRGAAEVSFLSHGARACGLDKHVPAFKGILIQPTNAADCHKFIPAADFDQASASRPTFESDMRPEEIVDNAPGAWIVMESTTAGFHLPCYLDLKLSAGVPRAGSVSPSWPHGPLVKTKRSCVQHSVSDQHMHASSAASIDRRTSNVPAPVPAMSAERIAKKRQRARQTTLHALGVKVVAGTLVRRCPCERPSQPSCHDKRLGDAQCSCSTATTPRTKCYQESFGLKYGRPCTQYSHLVDELRRFLVRPELRAQFRDAVATLQSKFSNSSKFTFHGTSMLLAFDGSGLSARTCGEANSCCREQNERSPSHAEQPVQLRWKLIDFANVHTHSTPVWDDGVIKGLTTLCRIADELVRETIV